MHISINSADPRPIYVQIVDEIRRAVVMKTLRPNDPLPSMRQLAVDLRLNPNTVAQAYRELERAGIVYARRGHGTFVAQVRSDGEEERRAFARAIAERALLDAHRNGLTGAELVEAVNEVVASRDLPTHAEYP